MMTQSLWRAIGIAVVTAVALVGVAYAQAGRSSGADGMDQLLSEVRALRAELKQASAASMRMQLLVARLSLQEQRIAALSRQSTDLQEQLATATQERSSTAEQLSRMTQALQGAVVPTEQQRDMEIEIASFKGRLAEQEQRELRLQTQFDQLSRTIFSEQSRWTEFNQRLDDLERSLPATAPR
jgi:chromosome segregation ATPase